MQLLAQSHKTRFGEWLAQDKKKAWGFKSRILFCFPLFCQTYSHHCRMLGLCNSLMAFQLLQVSVQLCCTKFSLVELFASMKHRKCSSILTFATSISTYLMTKNNWESLGLTLSRRLFSEALRLMYERACTLYFSSIQGICQI